MNIAPLLLLSAWLFCLGLAIVITKRNTIFMLMGTELMLNAANLNLLVFNRQWPQTLDGQMFALFITIIAVCEASVGLAIMIRVYHFYQTAIPDQISDLKET